MPLDRLVAGALASVWALAAVARVEGGAYADVLDDPGQWRVVALDRAVESARTVDDAYRRAEALASIARARVTLDDARAADRSIEEALQAAREVAQPAFRDWVLHDAALAQVAADDLHGARETAALIKTERPHAALLAALAEVELRRDELNAALTIAGRIRHVPTRSELERQVIAIKASRGEIADARARLRSIRDPLNEALARGDIAVALVRSGQVQAANELASRAPRKHRADVIGRIALAQIAAGDLGGALDTVQKIQGAAERAVMQGRLAVARAEAGEREGGRILLDAAVQTLEAAPSSGHTARALAQLARMQTGLGERDAAIDSLRRARAQVERLPAGEERDGVLEYVARSQARAGDSSGALASALLVRGRMARALLVRDVVSLDADADGAAKAREFDDPLLETAALFGVLGRQLSRKGGAFSGDAIENARASVLRLETPLQPAALAALAAACVRNGLLAQGAVMFRDSLHAAGAIERGEQRAAAYLRIVNALNDRLMFLGEPAEAQENLPGAHGD